MSCSLFFFFCSLYFFLLLFSFFLILLSVYILWYILWNYLTILTYSSSSFAQSVCIIGYTLFPLVIASLLSALGIPTIARIPVYLFLVAWSLAAGVSILGGSGVVKNRVAIAVYPLFVFYLFLGCLCFIS